MNFMPSIKLTTAGDVELKYIRGACLTSSKYFITSTANLLSVIVTILPSGVPQLLSELLDLVFDVSGFSLSLAK